MVLVVDDDPLIRDLVRDSLELEGYRVVAAEDGADGLGALRDAEPCVVLLDMRMPNVDGWEFARRYRARAGRPAPIVVMTAAENADRWCAEVAADACLPKPFALDDLYALVGRFCGRAPGHAAAPVTTATTLTCPACGAARAATIPTDACQFFYTCTACAVRLRPKPGDCCVFCSYATDT